MAHDFQTFQPRAVSTFKALFCVLLMLPSLGSIAAEALTAYTELEESANYSEDGQGLVPVGPGHNVVRAVLNEAGYDMDMHVVPWPRVIHSLETEKNVVGFSMTRTPEREDRYHWIGLIRPISFKLWTLAERADEMPRTLEEATHLRVSAIRGDVVENYLISKGFDNRVYLSESANAITMLRRGRIDVMPYIESGMASYLARKNEPLGTLVPVIDLEEISTGHYIVMSKQSDPELVQSLRNAYQRVAASGYFDLLAETAPN